MGLICRNIAILYNWAKSTFSFSRQPFFHKRHIVQLFLKHIWLPICRPFRMSKQNNFTLYSIKMSSIERSSSSKFNGWRKLLVFRTRALNAKNFLFQLIMKAHPLHRVMYKLKCPFLYVLLAIILLNSRKT